MLDPTFTHPEDVDLDAAVNDVADALIDGTGKENAVEVLHNSLECEILWLRVQRATLAEALDRVARGDDDPVSIAAAAMAEVGLRPVGEETGDAKATA